MQEKQEEEQKLQEQISNLEENAKQYLDNGALLRFGNLKSAFPEKCVQVTAVIGQLVQQGHLKQKLNDQEFKELLKNIAPEKKEIKIIRK